MPKSILGVLVTIAGMQLCAVTMNYGVFETSDDQEFGYMIMILVASCMVGFGNDGIAFLVGVCTYTVLHYGRMRKSD
jgi:hypothetical protein